MQTKILVLGLFSILASSLFGAGPALHFNAGVLVDANEKTVYLYDHDTSAKSTCYGACARAWPPVLAPNGTGPLPANVEVTLRNDGSRQLTYKGKPVYYYEGDENPGDQNGDGIGGIWHIISQ
jgi:predicted lipoprotein with Yx(FWY)xxD motif